jgi:hypothetical protein
MTRWLGVAMLVVAACGGHGRAKRWHTDCDVFRSLNADILVASGRSLPDFRAISSRLRLVPSVVDVGPVVVLEASAGEARLAVFVTGVDPKHVAWISDEVTSRLLGTLAGHERGAVLGADKAGALGVSVGDELLVTAKESGLVGAPSRASRLVVLGVLDVPETVLHPEMIPLFVSIATAQGLFGGGDIVHALAVKTSGGGTSSEAEAIRGALAKDEHPWTVRRRDEEPAARMFCPGKAAGGEAAAEQPPSSGSGRMATPATRADCAEMVSKLSIVTSLEVADPSRPAMTLSRVPRSRLSGDQDERESQAVAEMEKVIALDPERAQDYRHLFDMCTAGMTARQVACMLEEERASRAAMLKCR